MRWVVRLSVTIFLILVSLLFAIQWLGSFRDNPATSILELDVGQITQSCWHHICPGRTTFAAAESALRAETNRISNITFDKEADATFLCWIDKALPEAQICAGQSDPNNGIIDYVQIEPSDDFPVSLGDIIALVGSPTASNLCLSMWPEKNNAWVAGDSTTFSDGKVIVYSYTPNNLLAWRVDPAQTVKDIEFFSTPIPLRDGLNWTWRGFVPGPGNPVECVG